MSDSVSDLEVVRRGCELFGGDIDDLLALIHPEFEATTPPGLAAEPDTYRGHEGIRRYFDSFYDAMDRVWLEPAEFREVSGAVMVPGALCTRGRSTGLETKMDAVFVWYVRDGRVMTIEAHPDESSALASIERRQSAEA